MLCINATRGYTVPVFSWYSATTRLTMLPTTIVQDYLTGIENVYYSIAATVAVALPHVKRDYLESVSCNIICRLCATKVRECCTRLTFAHATLHSDSMLLNETAYKLSAFSHLHDPLSWPLHKSTRFIHDSVFPPVAK